MTKELENLTIIREYSHRLSQVGYLEINYACDDIEKELQQLEQIDNSKPSEALESLEVINNYGCGINDNMKFSEVFEKEYNTIKKALIKAQEQEKENNKLKSKLNRWLELLETDGINSKNMVATDIQHILEEIN